MADKDAELVFLPLGGVGEIGMNLALYGYGQPDHRSWLMVDCGISFPDETMPGVEVLMPDTRYAEAERKNIVGIVLTHAHEDHYGALLSLWPRFEVPVYATRFTAGLIAAKTEGTPGAPHIPVHVVEQGGHVRVGPFEVEYVALSHSIPEPNALAIRTPLGTIVHTGDWKMDAQPGVGRAIDLKRLEEIGAEGVRALMCDSTNALREGRSPSEAEIAKGLAAEIAKAPRRVAVTLFSSNVARIKAVAEAAKANDRSVVVVGRSLWRVIDVAAECGFLQGLTFYDEEAFEQLPRENVLALCTGSQGESRAALSRIAADQHRRVRLSRGDTVIFSSFTIPGNERAVGVVVNQLCERGIKIVTNHDAPVHTSGHPRRDELRDMYTLLKPEVAVPVHGEPQHLAAHAELAKSMGTSHVLVGRNGDVFRLAPDPADIVDEAPVGVLCQDGDLLLEPDLSGVADRRKLGFVGMIVVSLILDKKANIVGDPQIVLKGVPEADARGELFEVIVYKAVVGAVESIPRGRRRDPELVREAARRAARGAVVERWGKKPVCQVLVAVV